MFQSTETVVTNTVKTDKDPAIMSKVVAVPGKDSTKDAGRVHVGGGMMRF
jgi:hypothetical protein